MLDEESTVSCSVLFLDIVEYSKESVAGQMSLKRRLNEYIAAAIKVVPASDRIILDTGDGAAINFLGEIGHALRTALALRNSLLRDMALPALRLRYGINLGPVRLVEDINGQPNIIGDGINVAQRIMSFANDTQILVSGSYHDAIVRLPNHYIFHSMGVRIDKHVRKHEIYAVGVQEENNLGGMLQRSKAGWRMIGEKLVNFIWGNEE